MKRKKSIVLKRIASTVLVAATLMSVTFSTKEVYADVKPENISLEDLTVTVGSEFELQAKLSPMDADEDQLVWSIVKGKNVICFAENDDQYGEDEVEFKTLKAGTAKVRCKIKGTDKKAFATITVKKAPTKTITREGRKHRTVGVGDDFELEVNKSAGVKDSQLKWSIRNEKMVSFEDADRYGDDMEFVAKKTGTVTIICKNTQTKEKVKFKVTVTRSNYDDDDDWD